MIVLGKPHSVCVLCPEAPRLPGAGHTGWAHWQCTACPWGNGPKEVHTCPGNGLTFSCGVIYTYDLILLIWSSSQKLTYVDFYDLIWDFFTFCFSIYFCEKTCILYYFLHLPCRIKLKSNSGSETCPLMRSLSVNDAEKQWLKHQQFIFSHSSVGWLGQSTAGCAWACSRGCLGGGSMGLAGLLWPESHAWLRVLAADQRTGFHCTWPLILGTLHHFIPWLSQDSIPRGQKQKLRSLLKPRL